MSERFDKSIIQTINSLVQATPPSANIRYKYLPIGLSYCHALGIGAPLLGFCTRDFVAEAIAIQATYWEAGCHQQSIKHRQIKKSGPARTHSASPTLRTFTTVSEWIGNEKISLTLIPAAGINTPDVLTKKFSTTVKLLGYSCLQEANLKAQSCKMYSTQREASRS